MGEEKKYLSLTVTSNINEFPVERRFPDDITVASLKGKLELLTGAMMSSMKLELKNKDDEVLKKLSDDTLTLAQLDIENGMIIHVIDSLTNIIDEDVPDVAFQLSQEEYEKKEESMRQFLMKNKLGKYDEDKLQRKQEDEINEEKLSKSIKLGDRCEVRTIGNPTRRAEVKFVGEVKFKEGFWVGVQYDEPLGKNDGTKDGKRYFECRPKYGGFVRPSNIKVGDFPEIDELDEI